jgi:hypothetical protein
MFQRGDKRFSAYYARIRRLGNKSIEELYQAKKVFKDGATGLPIDEARGLRPVNDAGMPGVLFRALGRLHPREHPPPQGPLERIRPIRQVRQAGALLSGHRTVAHPVAWRLAMSTPPKLIVEIGEDGQAKLPGVDN